MEKNGKAHETKVSYYLTDGEDGQKINLEKKTDRFTVLFKEANESEIENKLKMVKQLTGIIPGKITDKIYEVIYENLNSLVELNDAMDKIRSRMTNVIAHHVYKQQGDDRSFYYLTDRIIVTFKPGKPIEKINSLIEKYHLKVIKSCPKLENAFIVEVTTASKENPIKIANKFETNGMVKNADPSLLNRLIKKPVKIKEQNRLGKEDSIPPPPWHLQAKRHRNKKLIAEADVKAEEAWAINGRGNHKIVIAIVDFNFNVNHDDLKSRITKEVDFRKFDFVDRVNPFPDPRTFNIAEPGIILPPEVMQRDDHGTKCCGIAVAAENEKGVIGIANGCTFLPVRIPGEVTDDELIDIVDYIDEAIDVFSCSIAPEPQNDRISSALRERLTRLAESGGRRGKGCVICFAAGNFNAPVNEIVNNFTFFIDNAPQGPISGQRIRNAYAVHPNVIAVSASTSLNKKAQYSNWGKEISVCAPSSNFKHDPRRILGPGIWTTSNFGEVEGGKYTNTFGGTSSATPLVAGIAALILSANPDLTASEVKAILQDTADKINLGDPKLKGTDGEYDENGHSKWFGYGKVNAANAVKEAIRLKKNKDKKMLAVL